MIEFRWLRPVLAGAVLLVVVAASFVARPDPASADANEVLIAPAAIEVAPGGSAAVQLIADPPEETLAVWAIEVAFDPDVVTTSGRNCDTLDPPPDSTMVGACLVTDKDGDEVNETLTVLAGLVFNDDGSGLAERTVLADITFVIVGSPGACSDLRLRTIIHSDSVGAETNPQLFDGRICVEQDAPPSGTVVPHTPEARTSEPTPTGTAIVTSPPDGGTATSADETPSDGTQEPSPGEFSASQPPGPVDGGEDGGGGGALIWVLVAAVALIAAAGAAWTVVRRRGAGSGPEGPPVSRIGG